MEIFSTKTKLAFQSGKMNTRRNKKRRDPNKTLGPLFCAIFAGIAVHAASDDVDVNKRPKRRSSKYARFQSFASVVVDGDVCMTLKDFIDSVIHRSPRPVAKRKVLTPDDIER